MVNTFYMTSKATHILLQMTTYLDGEYGGGGWCWRVLTGKPGITTVWSTAVPPLTVVVTAPPPVRCGCCMRPCAVVGEIIAC